MSRDLLFYLIIAISVFGGGVFYVSGLIEGPTPESVESAKARVSATDAEAERFRKAPRMRELSESWQQATMLWRACGLTTTALAPGGAGENHYSGGSPAIHANVQGPGLAALACMYESLYILPAYVGGISLQNGQATLYVSVLGSDGEAP